MNKKDAGKNLDVVNYEVSASQVNMSVRPFGQNRSAEVAYMKAERIVLATHLVTNFVPEREAIRHNIRTRAQDILHAVMTLREGFRSAGPDKVSDIAAQVREIMSLLDVAHASGFISNMNLEIVKRAYADLVSYLRMSEDGDTSESLALGEEYFTLSLGQSKGHVRKKASTPVKDTTEQNTSVQESAPVSSSGETKKPVSVREKRKTSSRRIAILDVLATKSPADIKDISKVITDCSEKTIQRELAKLVRDNVLKKEGTKRWTRYSLVV